MATTTHTDATDLKIQITVTDENSAAVDLSSVEGVAVHIFQGENTIIERFSQNAKADHNSTNYTEPDATNGVLQVIVHREKLQKKAQPGPIYARVEVQTNDTDFDGNSANVESARLEITTLVKSPSARTDLK